MAFELKLILESCLVPLGVFLVALAIAWLNETRLLAAPAAGQLPTIQTVGSWRLGMLASIVSIGWWLGVAISCSLLKGWVWWSPSWPWSDAWMLSLWPLLIASLIVGPSSVCCPERPWRLLFGFALALGSTWLILPRGPGWKDLIGEHGYWMMMVPLSMVLNGWSVERMHRQSGSRWSLWILVASLGAVFSLALQSYATMAQVTLSMLSVMMLTAMVGLLKPAEWLRSTIGPAVLAIGILTSWSRFRTYSPAAPWVYLLVLFTPFVIGMLDQLLVRWGLLKGRWVMAFLLSFISLIIVILTCMPGQEEEW